MQGDHYALDVVHCMQFQVEMMEKGWMSMAKLLHVLEKGRTSMVCVGGLLE